MAGILCVDFAPAYNESDVLIKIDFYVQRQSEDERLEDHFQTLQNEVSSIASDFYVTPIFQAAVLWKLLAEQAVVTGTAEGRETDPTTSEDSNSCNQVFEFNCNQQSSTFQSPAFLNKTPNKFREVLFITMILGI